MGISSVFEQASLAEANRREDGQEKKWVGGLPDTMIWIAVGIVLSLVILWAAIAYRRFYKREHFECPRCGYEWKPPLLRMIFSVNAVSGKLIRCPHCTDTSYMEPVKDRPDDGKNENKRT